VKPVCRVITTRKFEKQLDDVPEYIRLKAMNWIFMIELRGIQEISKAKGFHDEPLIGKRKGQRSIRLNRAYRLIYRVLEESLIIELLEVNKHDY